MSETGWRDVTHDHCKARVAELETELHKLAWSRDDRAKELEAEVENLQHNLERCRDGYTQTEQIRKRTAARLEQAIGGWNEAYLRAEKAEAKLAKGGEPDA